MGQKKAPTINPLQHASTPQANVILKVAAHTAYLIEGRCGLQQGELFDNALDAAIHAHEIFDPTRGNMTYENFLIQRTRWTLLSILKQYATNPKPEPVQLNDNTQPHHPDHTPHDLALKHETKLNVLSIIDGLPKPYRTVLALYHLKELTLRQIADKLQQPYSTTRKQLKDAEALFKAQYQSYQLRSM